MKVLTVCARPNLRQIIDVSQCVQLKPHITPVPLCYRPESKVPDVTVYVRSDVQTTPYFVPAIEPRGACIEVSG